MVYDVFWAVFSTLSVGWCCGLNAFLQCHSDTEFVNTVNSLVDQVMYECSTQWRMSCQDDDDDDDDDDDIYLHSPAPRKFFASCNLSNDRRTYQTRKSHTECTVDLKSYFLLERHDQ
jgi:hypothetical protein